MSFRRAAGAAALAAAALLPGAPRLAAQNPEGVRLVGVTATVHAGGTAFTRFQNVTLEAPGSPDGDYPASLSASTAASLAADLTVWFAPWLGGRLHVGYVPSNFEVRMTEDDREAVLGDQSDYQRLEYSDLSMFSATVALVLALPVKSTRVAPYVVLGAGGLLYSADDRGAQGLDQAFDGNAAASRIVGVAGLGVKIPLESARMALSFELMDHVARSPLQSSDDGRVLLDTGDLRVINRTHATAGDENVHYAHAIGIAAGLTFAIGQEPPGQ